eukprot:TRINITY_DN4465_c0_g1_i1.p1 TRINITY_DN4465_c0_g1~~TRINITY_DN4465_c0_g1_i1.p1  ORF type:complete len:649 (-),score=70.38 TRINITY_DN4465_c0_g1_i1:36-1898(-)
MVSTSFVYSMVLTLLGSLCKEARAHRIDGSEATVHSSLDRVLSPPAESTHDSSETTEALLVQTPGGQVRGMFATAWNGRRYRRWTNIPYGETTAGANRFRPPKPTTIKWDGARDATAFGYKCPQIATPGIPDARSSNISEDCLNLNIWAPATPADKLLPVYVSIYGGGYKYGTSNGGGFDGGELVTRGNVIQVGPNFRTGIFGFLALQEFLDADPQMRTTGNQGLQDARLALDWIHSNIKAFGGDPDRITIGGLSSGGGSVIALSTSLQMPHGMIHAVSSESPMPTFYPLNDALENGKGYAAALNCEKNKVECLQNLPWRTIQDYFDGLGSFVFPVIDGYEWDKQPADMQARYDGPLYIGDTTQEGTIFTMPFTTLITSELRYDAVVSFIFGWRAYKVLWQYGVNQYDSHGDKAAWYAFSDVVGDILFTCPARRYARTMVTQKKNVYYWLFGKVPDCDTVYGMEPSFENFWGNMGPFHGITASYFNGNNLAADVPICARNTTEKLHFWNNVHSNFVNFVQSGNPNGEGLDDFFPYTPGEWTRKMFNTPFHNETTFKDSKCDMWDSFGLERALKDLMWTMQKIAEFTPPKSLIDTGHGLYDDDDSFFALLNRIDRERQKSN